MVDDDRPNQDNFPRLGMYYLSQPESEKMKMYEQVRQLLLLPPSSPLPETKIDHHCRSRHRHPLHRLSKLSIVGRFVDWGLVMSCLAEDRDCALNLEELNLHGVHMPNQPDRNLAQLIRKNALKNKVNNNNSNENDEKDSHSNEGNCSSSEPLALSPRRRGWKTLGFGALDVDAVGPLTVAAILDENVCSTLENFRIGSYFEGFLGNDALHRLLCSAPKLKRFDTILVHYEHARDAPLLRASDIIYPSTLTCPSFPSSTEDDRNLWACLELESFKCWIGGVPRPDVSRRNNNKRLRHRPLHDPTRYTQQQSQTVQRTILKQLGRLARLKEITLGQDTIGPEDWDPDGVYMDDDNNEEDEILYPRSCHPQVGCQYACLNMTLEDGLDQLKGLTSMRRLWLERMSHGLGDAERDWIKDHWPDFGKKPASDTFWTERGHSIWMGECLYEQDNERTSTIDWW